ncbi:MAG: hypothetical protein JNL90_16555 [Planctomycetes bacterium]|nr:hypothetical protein [Planctomycetota bacterium]
MTPFAALVWKEWRGERRSIATLAGAAALLPLLGLLGAREFAGRFGLQRYAYDGGTATIVAQAALLAVALSLGAELLPSESRRGSIALLRRLPCGLLRPFLAKFMLLIVASLATALVAWASACAAVRATGGAWFPPLDFGVSLLRGAPNLLLIVVVGLLAFMASAWIGRATLALPVALLAVALALTPFWLARDDDPLLASVSTLVPLLWGAALLAPCVGALSFVLGRRRGGGEWRSFAIGGAAVGALALPAGAWRSERAAEWNRVDPPLDSFRVTALRQPGVLAAGGRYVYLTAHHQFGDLVIRDAPRWVLDEFMQFPTCGRYSDGPPHVLQVDLADGSWRDVGGPGSLLWLPTRFAPLEAVPYVGIRSCPEAEHDRAGWRALLDANDGREVARAPDVDERNAIEGRAEWDELARSEHVAYLGGARRVWFEREEWWTTDPDGGSRRLPDSAMSRTAHWWWRGSQSRGVMVQGRRDGPEEEEVEIYDFARERRFRWSDASANPSVRKGKWIVERWDASPPSGRRRFRWELYDPERAVSLPAPAEVADHKLLWIDDEGAAIGGPWGAHDQSLVTLECFDPESGVRSPIALPARLEALAGGVVAFDVVARTRLGAPIVRLVLRGRDGGKVERYARWDARRRELRVAEEASAKELPLVGCPDEESLLVIEQGRRLVRLRFGSDAREVVFPRHDAASGAPR